MIEVNNEEFVASADSVHVLKCVGDEDRTELVFFDSDDFANKKYLRDDEKLMYRSMLARVVIEQRYPGKTVVRAGDSQAAVEAEKNAQQSGNDMYTK
jgi:ketosteroid isomerase-like protein